MEGGISVTACPSGYSIGSSNWIFKTEYERIGYLSSSSTHPTHSRAVEWEKLHDADALILTSLSRTPEYSYEVAVMEVAQTIVDTLKRGGNVLMPVNPVGSIYDLIDGGAFQDSRIYFISPVAKGALAYSNVNAEWLAEGRQNSMYVPEEPFTHSALVRNGRLKIYENIYESFCREYKTPCVVLTGHPSLRIGDAPHLIEMWGNDSKNALIMTDPDYPLNEVYAPFEDLAIRAFYYPIEIRLEFTQVNTSLLIMDLKPKNSITPMKYDEQLSISLPSKKLRKRKMKISPERNLSGRVVTHPDGERKIVRIDSINSAITLDAEGMSTNIQSPKEHRMMLLDAVTSYLQALC
ncbi:unnamed protein product [Heligmosomoides polygyrus]|uniref:Beta-Casp domain-containing protein n=1 Tax=Heligmosomoides polygyrus TaxID=6339 RepID=A0A3P8HA61_HELPZ|nr:unnamed protein product [Heligmosomoides polygyrus]